MTDQQTLENLQNEISELVKTLNEVYPNWFDETIEEYRDSNGFVSQSVCVSVRAAIKVLSTKSQAVDRNATLVCVLCGVDWKGYRNRCECGGLCSWGFEKGKPLSWQETESGWIPNPPPNG